MRGAASSASTVALAGGTGMPWLFFSQRRLDRCVEQHRWLTRKKRETATRSMCLEFYNLKNIFHPTTTTLVRGGRRFLFKGINIFQSRNMEFRKVK